MRRVCALALAAIAAGATLVSFCSRVAADENLSIFSPVSPPANSVRDLFNLILAITGAIFLLVEGLIVYSAIRYRRKPANASTEPAQVYASAPLEMAWTVAPLLIVFVLFLVVVRSVVEAREDPTHANRIEVTVIGHQWWWEYVYAGADGKRIITANELHVPCDDPGDPTPVALTLESADVVHSFWVPRLAGKTDLIPGKTNRMWFATDAPATYYGQCAEFCGTQHANMKLLVISEPRADFNEWLANEGRNAIEDPTVAAGRERFLALACVNCHMIRGTSSRGAVGPDLTHLMARKTLAAGAAPLDRDKLLAWIEDPDSIKPGSLMPNMHLSKSDCELLVNYLETLK
ncbi:MAG TPA: cytochrome c oxidase subunit II [Pirellulales bacterium]